MNITDHQPPGAGLWHCYQHPDGHALMLNQETNELALFDADSLASVAIPIGGLMLVEVGRELVALGKKMLAKQDCFFNNRPFVKI